MSRCPYPWKTPDGRSNPEAYRWYREHNKELHRAIERRRRLREDFGLTVEQYEQMYSTQNGKCAICQDDECSTGRRLAVDHDATTGTVRGLLCFRCNRALGGFKDDPNNLRRAVAYLLRERSSYEEEDEE